MVPTAGGEPQRLGASGGYDGGCAYSPDGRLLAWRAQDRGGYEADRWQLVVRERQGGAERRLTAGLDRQVDSFAFSPDSRTVYFVVEEDGHARVHSVPAAGGPIATVIDAATLGDLRALPDGRTLVASEASLLHPAEIVRFASDGRGGIARLTHVNDDVLAPLGLRPGESVRYTGAAGKPVQAWLVKPPDFDPARRYPLLVLVHGGPQGAWTDGWTYRWNAEVFASAGFVVFMPNPRGSVGWGQEFTDDINRRLGRAAPTRT